MDNAEDGGREENGNEVEGEDEFARRRTGGTGCSDVFVECLMHSELMETACAAVEYCQDGGFGESESIVLWG